MIDSSPRLSSLPYVKEFLALVDTYTRHFQGFDLPADHLTPAQVSSILSACPLTSSDELVWSRDIAQDFSEPGCNLLALVCPRGGYVRVTSQIVACWVAGRGIGAPEFQRPLRVIVNELLSKDMSTGNPVRILEILLSGYPFSADFQAYGLDFDYRLHCFLAQRFGLSKFWDPSEKLSILPWTVGSIVTLFTKRGKLTEESPFGDIVSQKLCEVVAINSERKSITLRSLNITSTLEDQFMDFMRIPSDCRGLFRDLPRPKPIGKPFELLLMDVGINYCMLNEPYLMTGLSRTRDVIQSWVTLKDGSLSILAMDEINTLYWAMMQRGFPLNLEVFFRDNPGYSHGSMSWDMLGAPMDPRMVRRAVSREGVTDGAMSTDLGISLCDDDDILEELSSEGYWLR